MELNLESKSGPPIVLIAGTSGSGKTTVAREISEITELDTLILPLDNYEKQGIDCQVEPDGYINWENPITRNFGLLYQNLSDLSRGHWNMRVPEVQKLAGGLVSGQFGKIPCRAIVPTVACFLIPCIAISLVYSPSNSSSIGDTSG